ncbi:MAG: hypothetical protein DELT_02646 [Desulfovibrio sp.]
MTTKLPRKYIAHVREDNGTIQALSQHLANTATLAEFFAARLDLPLSGRLLGLLHDFGKYSEAFQKYIKSATGLVEQDSDDFVDHIALKGKIDHSSAGAQLIWNRLKDKGAWGTISGQLLALAIASHHSGLIDCLAPDGRAIFLQRMAKEEKSTRREECVKNAEDPFLQEALSLLDDIVAELHAVLSGMAREHKEKFSHGTVQQQKEAKNSLYFKYGLVARFLLSCLLDADRTDSAEFEKLEYAALRKRKQAVDWNLLARRLENKLAEFTESGPVNDLRAAIATEYAHLGQASLVAAAQTVSACLARPGGRIGEKPSGSPPRGTYRDNSRARPLHGEAGTNAFGSPP